MEDDGPEHTDKPQIDYSAVKIWLFIAVICTIFFSGCFIYQNYNLRCGNSEYCNAILQSIDDNVATYSAKGIEIKRYTYGEDVDNVQKNIPIIIKNGKVKSVLTIAKCWPIPISWVFMLISFISCKEEYMNSLEKWEIKENKKKGRG